MIGVNETAIRLPSAFAALFTGLLLLWFFLKYRRDFWAGFSAVLVLVTTQGYVDFHAARTGDCDALLTLFMTASCLTNTPIAPAIKNAGTRQSSTCSCAYHFARYRASNTELSKRVVPTGI